MTSRISSCADKFDRRDKNARSSFLIRRTAELLLVCGLIHSSPANAVEPGAKADYLAVNAIFNQHCLDCHGAQDPEAQLVLESFETLMKGGESGPAVVPGKSADSLLVQMVEGRVERKGKKLVMPPGKRKKLDAVEIAAITAWIDTGAPAPPPGTVATLAKELVVPKITPKVPPRRDIKALAYAPSSKLIAVARYDEVELVSAESQATVRRWTGNRGGVNALAFSPDGSALFAAGGEAGLFGEVRQWNVADGKPVRTIEGHRDAIYAVALSPDGKILATGSYDQKIKLWKVETGQELRTLSGHNGAVFDLSFRPDGKILASASADRTVKLWDVASGERRDTLLQPLKELYTVAFSPDGKRLVAGGVDNRIRVWQISDTAAETTNPLLESRFAHEGAILKLVFSSDGKSILSSAEDRTVKLWDAAEVKERLLLPAQPDWPTALTFALDNRAAVVGGLDGALRFYDSSNGQVLPPPKPELVRAEPRGLQRGKPTKIKLAGKHLAGLTELKFSNAKLSGRFVLGDAANSETVWAEITAAPDLKRGAYDVWVAGPTGESGKLSLQVDNLPQRFVPAEKTNRLEIAALPLNLWGVHEKSGDADEFSFFARSGQTIVFDIAAKSFGSKSDPVLTLMEAQGKVLASNNGFDASPDPFLAYTFPADGHYTARVSELLLAGSADHFYRLSMGELPYVTGCFPLSAAAGAESEVELIGVDLPANHKVKVKTRKAGEVEVPIDSEEFRTRRTFKLLVSDLPEVVESEPNDKPSEATPIPAPASVNGRIGGDGKASDADLFRFDAKAGQVWIIETAAAQRGSPADTKVEVLSRDGKPVPRLALQAVRNSAVTFRGIDSNSADCRVENWEEMELNQYLYLQGEVVKLFRAPQGPDSGFVFYTSNGKRRTYFDTSATSHANEEPCYIVEPHPPDAKLVSNGLPVFPISYQNDDDAERKLGTDSRLTFTAPADGSYWIRVTDTRGDGGDRFVYRLVLREARPDFAVTLNGANPIVNRGSGREFSVSVNRIDGFDGEVNVEISGLPPGFSVSSPLVVQAGHNEAKGTIHADAEAPEPSDQNAGTSVVVASAKLDGRVVTKRINNFGRIKLGEKPKLFVALEPDPSAGGVSGQTLPVAAGAAAKSLMVLGKPLEITIAPGATVPAWLKIKRNGHEDLVTFTVENLPHGLIVDNIGLNGVLIPKDQNERQIFLTAAKWVPETDRQCFAVENQAGRQTSLPVLLHVRQSARPFTAAAKAAETPR